MTASVLQLAARPARAAASCCPATNCMMSWTCVWEVEEDGSVLGVSLQTTHAEWLFGRPKLHHVLDTHGEWLERFNKPVQQAINVIKTHASRRCA